ncbi:MAG: hypothetical protein OEM58_04025 [Nitrospirota bacterium]|nr:hypothetical protein [Nitrospirota bacterium]
MKTSVAWVGRLLGFVLIGGLLSTGAYGDHLDVPADLAGTSPDCHGRFLGKQVPW